MAQQRTGQRTNPDLDSLALAFVVRVQGTWTSEALATWQAQLFRKGAGPAADEVEAALARARERFETGPAHLFVCNGLPCRRRQKFGGSPEDLQRLEVESQLSITATECQGPCKQAPVATVRAGQRCEMFAQFIRGDDWRTVTDFAERTAEASTLLVPPGAEQPFRFDPVHDHDTGSGPLQQFEFLSGHFQGTGTSAEGGEVLQKECVGSWTVAGRFLGLRMSATYPLSDGRKDTHTAFVMLGVNPDSGKFEGRAYSDGGGIHDYPIEMDGDAVTFRERAESYHHVRATRARKLLCPTADGYDERLEVDRGSGQFDLYYRIPFRRVGP